VPVLERVIPLMPGNGNDIIAHAQTGTGITTAFGLTPVLATDKQIRDSQSLQIPTGSENCGKQRFHWVNKLDTFVTDHPAIETFLPEIKLKLEKMDSEELIRRVVSPEFDRFLDNYRNGEELIEMVVDKWGREDKLESKSPFGVRQGNYLRLFIKLRISDGFYSEKLTGLINSNAKGRKIPIRKIDSLKGFSSFEAGYADMLIGTL
jgi:ATP-dependent RNA helicase DeaD